LTALSEIAAPHFRFVSRITPLSRDIPRCASVPVPDVPLASRAGSDYI
jgi:hypothetical protein